MLRNTGSGCLPLPQALKELGTTRYTPLSAYLPTVIASVGSSRQCYCLSAVPCIHTTLPLPAQAGSAQLQLHPLSHKGAQYLLWGMLPLDGSSEGCLLTPFLEGIPLLEDPANKK